LDVNARLELELDVLKGLVRKYRTLIERLQPRVDDYIDGIAAEDDEDDEDNDNEDVDNDHDDDNDTTDVRTDIHSSAMRAIHSTVPPKKNLFSGSNKIYVQGVLRSNASNDSQVGIGLGGGKSNRGEKLLDDLRDDHFLGIHVGKHVEEEEEDEAMRDQVGVGPGVKGYKDDVPSSFLIHDTDLVHDSDLVHDGDLVHDDVDDETGGGGEKGWYRSKRDVNTLGSEETEVDDDEEDDDEAIYRGPVLHKEIKKVTEANNTCVFDRFLDFLRVHPKS